MSSNAEDGDAAAGATADGPQGEGVRSEAEMEELVRLASRCLDMARSGDTATLAAYVDAGVPVDLTDGDGSSLLLLAGAAGHADTVVALAERGADVDRLDDRGLSPLAAAVLQGRQEVVAVLLLRGADPDRGTPTAREAAEVSGHQDLLQGVRRDG
ncbi:ankyrin repeat domain-containing protein [Auraticoccus cholistanensis]|nr:ankyrin repeat domain-containing protein [Auraticoccus cholistanensis]